MLSRFVRSDRACCNAPGRGNGCRGCELFYQAVRIRVDHIVVLCEKKLGDAAARSNRQALYVIVRMIEQGSSTIAPIEWNFERTIGDHACGGQYPSSVPLPKGSLELMQMGVLTGSCPCMQELLALYVYGRPGMPPKLRKAARLAGRMAVSGAWPSMYAVAAALYYRLGRTAESEWLAQRGAKTDAGSAFAFLASLAGVRRDPSGLMTQLRRGHVAELRAPPQTSTSACTFILGLNYLRMPGHADIACGVLQQAFAMGQVPPDVRDTLMRDGQLRRPLPVRRLTSAATRHSCAFCRKAAVPSKCSGCLAVYYCDAECQIRDWTRHELECGKP